jgi:hypothetical protein
MAASALALFAVVKGAKSLQRLLEVAGIFNPIQLLIFIAIGFFYYYIAAVGLFYFVDMLKPIIGEVMSILIVAFGLTSALSSAVFATFYIENWRP